MPKMKLTDMLKAQESPAEPPKDTPVQAEAEPEKKRISIPAIDAATKTDNSTVKTQRYREIDPTRCRPWSLHNRDAVWLTPENCADLIDSIRRDGQLDLGLVRPLQDDPDHDYEIIYGVRRWYSVSQLPRTLFKARITDADDKACTLLMHVENEQARDISALEKGRSYRLMLDKAIYSTAAELSRELGITRAYVSMVTKAIEILDVPKLSAVLAPHIREISYKDAKELATLIEKPRARERAETVAIELGQADIGDPKVMMRKLLVAAAGAKEPARKSKPAVSLFKKGKKSYVHTTEKSNGAITITIEPGLKEAAGDEVSAILQRIDKTLRRTMGLSASAGADESDQ